MSKEKIVIVEDEKNIVELLKYNLEKEGYQVLYALQGDEGLDLILKEAPDFIVLDLMLPGMDGIEVCKSVRQNSKVKNTPVLMLTAKSEELDKILGLELGADDYMTKPFSPRELVARIKAILRRASASVTESETAFFRVGDLEVDTGKHIVTVKGKRVELTSKEYDLLKTLLEAKGRVLTRDLLLDKVWGYDQSLEIETRTVDMHIGQLRKKIKSESKRILTVKNAGYRFDDE